MGARRGLRVFRGVVACWMGVPKPWDARRIRQLCCRAGREVRECGSGGCDSGRVTWRPLLVEADGWISELDRRAGAGLSSRTARRMFPRGNPRPTLRRPSMEPLLGSIHLFPYPFTPRGYLPCDGQLLDIRENSHLFQLIGNTFGGDGTTTFAVP